MAGLDGIRARMAREIADHLRDSLSALLDSLKDGSAPPTVARAASNLYFKQLALIQAGPGSWTTSPN